MLRRVDVDQVQHTRRSVDLVQRAQRPALQPPLLLLVRRLVRDPTRVHAVHVDAVLRVVPARRPRHHVQRRLRHVRVRVRRRLEAVELPLHRRHVHHEVLLVGAALGACGEDALQHRVDDERRQRVDGVDLRSLLGRHLVQVGGPRVLCAPVLCLLHRVVHVVEGPVHGHGLRPRVGDHVRLRLLLRVGAGGGVGVGRLVLEGVLHARLEGAAAAVDEVAPGGRDERRLEAAAGLALDEVLVVVGRTCDGLRGVVHDGEEGLEVLEHVPAELLDRPQVPQVQRVQLQPVLPRLEVLLLLEPLVRILHEPRRRHHRRTVVQQLQRDLVPDLDPRPRQQHHLARQVPHLHPLPVVERPARLAQRVVEVVHLREALLADVALARRVQLTRRLLLLHRCRTDQAAAGARRDQHRTRRVLGPTRSRGEQASLRRRLRRGASDLQRAALLVLDQLRPLLVRVDREQPLQRLVARDAHLGLCQRLLVLLLHQPPPLAPHALAQLRVHTLARRLQGGRTVDPAPEAGGAEGVVLQEDLRRPPQESHHLDRRLEVRLAEAPACLQLGRRVRALLQLRTPVADVVVFDELVDARRGARRRRRRRRRAARRVVHHALARHGGKLSFAPFSRRRSLFFCVCFFFCFVLLPQRGEVADCTNEVQIL
eukprot:Rhum_TRINITY_DN14343_c21_g1::Rhum_TRINITY_DN14343_c21_g1_i1::g.83921::m.83921